MSETFFSIDIETNGLCPGINSMISLGAVAFDPETGAEHTAFKVNLQPLAEGIEDPDTMNWWKGFPEAYERATRDAQPPDTAMRSFVNWVKAAAGASTPVACYWKPEFDGAFVRYYLFRFTGGSPFGPLGRVGGFDIRLLVSLARNTPISETKIGEVPSDWGFPCGKTAEGLTEHNHDALDDAREQKNVYLQAMREIAKLRTK